MRSDYTISTVQWGVGDIPRSSGSNNGVAVVMNATMRSRNLLVASLRVIDPCKPALAYASVSSPVQRQTHAEIMSAPSIHSLFTQESFCVVWPKRQFSVPQRFKPTIIDTRSRRGLIFTRATRHAVVATEAHASDFFVKCPILPVNVFHGYFHQLLDADEAVCSRSCRHASIGFFK